MKKCYLIVLIMFAALSANVQAQLYMQGFNGGSVPADWSTLITNDPGTDPAITFETTSLYPAGLVPTEGTHMVRFNSYDVYSGGSIRLFMSTGFSTMGGYSGANVSFDWMTDDEYTSPDRVVVQYSIDAGTTWNDVSTFNREGTAAAAFGNVSCVLPPAAMNQADVRLAFHFISGYGNDCYLDNLVVTGITTPLLSVTPSSLDFGFIPFGSTSGELSYSISGLNLTGAPGNIVVTASSGFELSLTSGSGFATSLNIPYTTASLPATTVYARFTPAAAGQAYTSVVVNAGGGASADVWMDATSLLQYCESTADYAADEDIFNVSLAGINNTSDCTMTGGTGSTLNQYSNYYSTVVPGTAMAGSSIPFSVQIGTCGTSNYDNVVGIFGDFNQDGDFEDAGEILYISSVVGDGPHTETGSLLIPASAKADTLLIRVVNVETSDPLDITPCGIYGYGETEDYALIVSIPSCFPPSNLNATPIDPGTELLGWTTGGASVWNIAYGTGAFTPPAGTIVHNVTSNPYLLNGLIPSTTYSFYVQDSCGAGNVSVWTGPFTFTTLATCPGVDSIRTVSVGFDQAVINWHEKGLATSWQVEYGVAGFTQGAGIRQVLSTRPMTLTPLAENTQYDVYIRSICAAGDTSTWSPVFQFATPCDFATVPYLEDFETSSANCWTIVDVDGGGTSWGLSTTYNHTTSGAYSAIHNYSADGMQDGYAYSPGIIMPATGSVKLAFWSYNVFPTWYYKNSLLISTNNGATYTELWTPSSVTAAWVKDSLDLSAYVNDTIILAFHYEGDDAHTWYVDDISITSVTANADLAVYQSNVSECDTLGWFNPPIVFTNAGSTTIPNGTVITATYQVDANTPVSENFTLTADLLPSGTTGFDFTTPLHFNQYTTYNCRYTIALSGDVNTANDTSEFTVSFTGRPVVNLGNDTSVCADASILLSAGNPGMTYNWWNGTHNQTVTLDSSFCSGLGTCNFWVEVEDANGCSMTDSIHVTWYVCSGIRENESNISLNIIPNPNNGSFTLDLGDLTGRTNVQVLDLNGRLIEERTLELKGSEKPAFDLSARGAGVYYLRLLNNENVAVQKIVVH